MGSEMCIRDRSGSRLTFQTPSATAGIRGTDWELDVDAKGKTMLTVFSGQVEFYNEHGRITLTNNEAAVAEVGRAPVKMLLSNPRERIQWVNALSADPLRHLQAKELPAPLRPVLSALAQGDLKAARIALTAAGLAPADWQQILHSALAILAGDSAGAQQGPSISGIITSSRIKSGADSPASARPMAPVVAICKSKSGSSAAPSVIRLSGVSSIASIPGLSSLMAALSSPAHAPTGTVRQMPV